MPTFIKTGYWESAVKSYKGWLNLEELINSSGVITGSGTAGRLAFWTAPSVQSATTNLFWDNVNNRLAIGSAPLTADFEINKNSAVFQAYRNINSGTNLTTGAVVYQLDILGQRNGGASSFARSQVVYNGDGITRRGRWIFGVAEASGFGGSSFMLSQTSSSVKIVNIGFNAPQYSDSDTTITTAYAQHATVVVNGQTTLPLMSWDINGFAQNVMFSDGNLALNSTSNLGFKLDVNGTARVSGAATFGNLINISVGVNSGLRYDSSNYFYVDAASGFVLNSWDYTIVNNVSGTGYGGILIRSGTTGSKQASAHLQVDSTTRGFLPPRMTTAQKNAIVLPAAGLVVYDTTDNRHYGYNGSTWNAFY